MATSLVSMPLAVLALVLAAAAAPASAAAPALKLNTTSIASGDWVRLDWSGVAKADRDGCWIGVFSPPDVNVSAIPALPYPASAPWTATATVKYITCAKADPGSATSGAGHYNFSLIDMREDVAFWLFTGGIDKPKPLVKSESVSFTDKDAPRDGHLALTGDPTSMLVVWGSGHSDPTATLMWGVEGSNAVNNVTAETYTYTADDLCGDPARTQGWREPGFFHKALIKGLASGDNVWYQYGSDVYGWSKRATFRAPQTPGPNVETHLLVTADVGATEPDNCDYHWEEPDAGETYRLLAAHGPADVTLHVGDISYATGYSAKWDLFMATQVSQLKGVTPLMTAQGNHERDVPGTGTHYDTSNDSGGECGKPTQARFQMPTPSHDQDKGWYSFNVGSVHVIMMDTEMECGPGSAQYAFFESDLAAVDRKVTPWVIFAGHRPMYYMQSTGSAIDSNFQQFEPLLMKHQVDLVLWGHVHNALVTCPVYNGTCVKPSSPGAYDAPIHAVIGNGGQSLSGLPKTREPWDIYHVNEFGYSTITAYNATTLEMKLHADDGDALHYSFTIERKFPRV